MNSKVNRSEPGRNAPCDVLIISHDVIGAHMAGPGIRYYHLARVLAREFSVILAVPAASDQQCSTNFTMLSYRSGQDHALEQVIQSARAILVPAIVLNDFPMLLRSSTPIIVDGYNPFTAETLTMNRGDLGLQQASLTQTYLRGDFFICASERQRDWWLGVLEAMGRVNVYTYGADPSLRRLVNLVPFGLPEKSPVHSRRVIKGVWQGIGEADRVIVWGGGLWPWLDPLTAVHAIARVWEARKDVRLIFPGTLHPNPAMAQIPTQVQAARELARQLGLLDRVIYFSDWIPYVDWQNVLLESDIALTLHASETLESHLAFRSRVLDYIWAGVPIVASRGDATSDLIAKYDLGLLVDCCDADAVADSILHLLDTSRSIWETRFERARHALTWECAARPLIEFCRAPQRAPDKIALEEQLGNPFYVDTVRKLQEDKAQLRHDLTESQNHVKAFEQRRVVRLINFIQRFVSHFWKAK